MKENQLRTLAYATVSILGGGALLFLFFKHVFLLVLPFLIAWAIAFMIRPLAAAIGKAVKIPQSVLRATLAILISVAVLSAVSLGVWMLAMELWRLLSGIGEGEALRELIDRITSGGIFGGIFDTLGDTLGEIFYDLILSLATSLGGVITGAAAAVPRILLTLVITVISTVYFSYDLERVNSFVTGILPPRVLSWFVSFKRGFFSVGLKYIRSYLFLMLITYAVILVGLVLLGRPYALLLALVIAVLDLLPVIGVGTVLVPWSVYELVLGDTGVGVGLLVLFAAHTFIRQLAEPKIVGKTLGVHPIITLLLLYVGYSLFGFVGLLLVPIVTVLIEITVREKNTAEVDGDLSRE